MVRFLRALVIASLGFAPSWASAASPPVMVVPLNGAIGPASADFVTRALARAAEEHAQLVVLEIDTPGGLDRSMRQIVKDILASPVPVAAFVAPERRPRRQCRARTFSTRVTSPRWRRAPTSAPPRR